MIDAAMKRWGQIDCLFNNASGNSAAGPIDGLSYTDFLAAMDFRGSVFPRRGTKYVTPVMKKQRSGLSAHTKITE